MIPVNAKRYCLFIAAGATLVSCLYLPYLSNLARTYASGNLHPNFYSGLEENKTSIQEKKFVYYLCPAFRGGLGNIMFQYASVYGIAATKAMEMIIGKDQELLKVFKLRAQVHENMDECKRFEYRLARYHCAYDKQVLNFNANKSYNIMTYLQSWKYFEAVADDIRKQFNFRDAIYRPAEKIVNAIKRKYKQTADNPLTLVGVHIRRGDFVNNKNTREYGYLVATGDYIQHAMDYFLSNNYSNVVFVVCSNDMEWSKNTISRNYTVEYILDNDRTMDIAILSLCSHTIITVGTFGWWAAWLAGGDTVYYKHMAREDSELRKQFSSDYTDYFWPEWIGMD